MNLFYRFKQFMYGRYGLDNLGKFLIIATFILMIFSRFDRSLTCYLLSIITFALYLFRFLSKNTYKRAYENDKYMKVSQKVRTFITLRVSHMKQRKTHHIYSCPQCKQKIRIPRGKGKICIKCPKCKNEFIRKS